jgi:hypothetical protein
MYISIRFPVSIFSNVTSLGKMSISSVAIDYADVIDLGIPLCIRVLLSGLVTNFSAFKSMEVLFGPTADYIGRVCVVMRTLF